MFYRLPMLWLMLCVITLTGCGTNKAATPSRSPAKPPPSATPQTASAARTPQFSAYSLTTPNSIPSAITAGPDGSLWFTEEGSDRIGRITTSGSITEYPLSSQSGPSAITSGPDGALWFIEGGAGKIGRITTAGQVRDFPLPSTATGLVGITRGSDGALWFTEQNADKIGRMTTDGVVTEFPLPRSGNSAQCGVQCPSGIASGPDDALWFTESNLSPLGTKIGRITTSGEITEYPLGSENTPDKITAGFDGALWFTEQRAGRIGRITTNGDITGYAVTGIPPGTGPDGIAASPDGTVWFTVSCATPQCNGPHLIGRITRSRSATVYVIPEQPGGPAVPTSIAEGSDGAYWFTESQRNAIGRAMP